MKIEIVVDPARPVTQSLASRVAPPPQAAPANGAQTQGARLVLENFANQPGAYMLVFPKGPAHLEEGVG